MAAGIKPTEDPDEQSEIVETVTGPEVYWYCTEENHPGAPNFQTTPLSVTRIFSSNPDLPVCPACGKQTNAMRCDGPDIPPEFILELQDRFGR